VSDLPLLKINSSKSARGLEHGLEPLYACLYGDARSAKSFEVLTLIFLKKWDSESILEIKKGRTRGRRLGLMREKQSSPALLFPH
jgi:hypothetical protein